MSRYDGLIIPRSYSEYINKTDAATLQQALQLSGVLSNAVAAGDNKAVKSGAVNTAIEARENFPSNTNVSSYDDLYVNGKTTRYTVADGVANAPSAGVFMVTSVSSPAQVSSNYYGYQIAVQVGNGINMATYLRLKNGSNNWTSWEKIKTAAPINGIFYDEYIDDFNLKYLSGTTFLSKYTDLNKTGVFYSLEMTAIEKNTGKYVRVLYNCKKDTNASFLVKESNGLSITNINNYGTCLINDLSDNNSIIQKTKILAVVPNGTYIPVSS